MHPYTVVAALSRYLTNIGLAHLAADAGVARVLSEHFTEESVAQDPPDAPPWVGPMAPSDEDIRERNDARLSEERAEMEEALRGQEEDARKGRKLRALPKQSRPDTTVPLPYDDYDHIVVGFSGGKDSLASLLRLHETLSPAAWARVELQHHVVDGDPRTAERVFDWACTEDYCRKVAAALGVPIYFSWRDGGILREMQREGEYRQGVTFETPGGTRKAAQTDQGKLVTRRQLDAAGNIVGSPAWPQQSGDLNVRWCSATVKIEVARTVFAHDPRFKRDARILLITGERREESAGRSKYAYAEEHASNAWAKNRRRVDQVRLLLDWTTPEVWGIIQRHGIVPHPCYWLGFGRASCETCIFNGREEWATLRDVDPRRFERVLGLERWAGATIEHPPKGSPGRTIEDRVRGGYAVTRGAGKARVTEIVKPATSFAPTDHGYWRAQALAERVTMPIRVDPAAWALPAGAFRKGAGPT